MMTSRRVAPALALVCVLFVTVSCAEPKMSYFRILEEAATYADSSRIDPAQDVLHAARLRKIVIQSPDDETSILSAYLLLGRLREKYWEDYPEVSPDEINDAQGSVGVALFRQKGADKERVMNALVRDAYCLCSSAQIMLNILYEFPVEGYKSRDSRILGFYQRTAKEGLKPSQEFYGKILLQGLGVKADRSKGVKLLEAAGSAEAWLILAGDSIGRNERESAKRYCRKAAELGDANGFYNLGVFAQEEQDYATAVSHFEQTLRLDTDCHEARLELARMYLEGWGVPVDLQKGIGIMHQVSVGENKDVAAVAHVNLGVFYATGRGVEQSDTMANQHFHTAKKLGFVAADQIRTQVMGE